ncbi:hypothetical protein DFJ58DRAFT_729251 [Suillus subalutaceus]|uniref:uncharacterized protein n=1 Tax=Suillus subalutaceus TaxID=48586 RepID=UPI001B870C16|nr:uncharacterized protein DFJ58DRAFT_729251 [Suillus subalutaceus]KAG1850371.1 hypothetical protein DFJ58DRAFT_729251 [Suillus subalutaceus]
MRLFAGVSFVDASIFLSLLSTRLFFQRVYLVISLSLVQRVSFFQRVYLFSLSCQRVSFQRVSSVIFSFDNASFVNAPLLLLRPLVSFERSSTMARTKNTAKKSNGGSAPRILLTTSRTGKTGTSGVDAQRRKALTASKVTTVGGGDLEKRNAHHKALTAAKATLPIGGGDLDKLGGHNEFCILCRDGAERYEDNTLFMCALCPRVVCRLCLQLPPDLETKVLQEDVSFRCICCHIKMEQGGTYFGFYNANGLPALDRFLPINGALELSELAEISAAPVIFIHLILVNLSVAGSPLEFAHSFLKPYYTGDGIEYLDVYYDIGSDAKAAPYRSKVWKMIKVLKNLFIWERVVIGISTHTDEDFGNPFIGYEDGDTNNYLSTLVDDVSFFFQSWPIVTLVAVLGIILQPWQTIIDHAQESYLWMLCCGSLVNNSDSFHGLQEAVAW